MIDTERPYYVKVAAAIECPDCGGIESPTKAGIGLDRELRCWTLRNLFDEVAHCGCVNNEEQDTVWHFSRNHICGDDGIFVDLSPHALDADGELTISVADALGEGAG